ncbi:MAG: multidrug effflux MFS transporter [Desulfobulbaceae bacterium]|nr:multidrug effflux MFS transporter [Desulfobulbaceae bacterium]
MSPLRLVVVLGVLSAIGPLAIDMYLPALPSIGQSLGASMTAVQMSLLVYFLSLGIGQAIYGPLSDQIGRKPPMYFGLTLFIVGSIGCALAPNIQILIISRFFQGSGACAAMVIPPAIVRDLHTGNAAVKLMARLMLVFSVSPLLAPLAGSLLSKWYGWRSVFWVITLLGLSTLAMLVFRFPETQPVAGKNRVNLRTLMSNYGALLRDRNFLQLVAIGALSVSSFFLYLANSSFVLINHYGLTPIKYSIAFSVNAVAFIGAAQFAGKFGKRFGLVEVLKTALKGYGGIMSLLLVFYLFGLDRVEVLTGMLFIGYGLLGLIMPTCTVLALDGHGAVAGSASALLGAARFVTGAAIMGGVGLLADGSPLPMLGGIAVCAITALALATGPCKFRGRNIQLRS